LWKAAMVAEEFIKKLLKVLACCEEGANLRSYLKKKRVVVATTTIPVNLKSNTMKNTMQRYNVFLRFPNNGMEKYSTLT
jgi:hypothetical protein